VRLHRFYVAGERASQISGGVFDVTERSQVDQLKKVFRLKVGDTIVVFNGDGNDHECSIQDSMKDKIVLLVQKTYPSRFMPEQEVWLYASIVKKDNFEWIAEKATELGVSHIVPVMSERSEKKSLNLERLEKIVIEASEQSGRGDVPMIHPIVSLGEAIDQAKISFTSGPHEVLEQPREVIAFHTEGEFFQRSGFGGVKSVAVFIGPEGGWSEREVELFHIENIPVKCLGKQVLRAETAAVAALAQFVF